MEPGSTLEKHFLRFKDRFPDATIQVDQGARTHSIHIPAIDLPAGWNKGKTAIWLTVPDGYPSASPDCFWSEDLRTVGGGEPKNSGITSPHPMAPPGSRWYSWHVKDWSPSSDDLLSYVSTIRDRLKRIE